MAQKAQKHSFFVRFVPLCGCPSSLLRLDQYLRKMFARLPASGAVQMPEYSIPSNSRRSKPRVKRNVQHHTAAIVNPISHCPFAMARAA